MENVFSRLASLTEFYNQCHESSGENGGRFCEGEDGPGREAVNEAPPPADKSKGWKQDKTGRYSQRYWDGNHWTKHVADRSGKQGIDEDLSPRDVPEPKTKALPGWDYDALYKEFLRESKAKTQAEVKRHIDDVLKKNPYITEDKLKAEVEKRLKG